MRLMPKGYDAARHLASAIAVLVMIVIAPARAPGHEIAVAVADFTLTATEIEMLVYAPLEPIIAGINLSAYQDTNDAPQAARHDALRKLPVDELARLFRENWTEVAPRIVIRAGDARVAPDLVSVEIDDVPDLTLPREGRFALRADLPPDGTPVVLGWDESLGPLVLRAQPVSDDAFTAFLREGQLSDPLPRDHAPEVSLARFVSDAVVLGFVHIIPRGLDHILFVLGLFLFALAMGPLLWQVTAFTLAHTITLALAVLGVVAVPAAIVEPLIAASIAYVAVENIRGGRLGWHRVAIVFGFGLLHGLGFASVFREIGFEGGRLVVALVGFNIGVEAGQIAVIAGAWLVAGLPFGRRPWYRRVIVIPASAAIALIAFYWVIERTLL